MTNIITMNAEVTMTSREIAELTGKRHDNVMQVIRDLIAGEILTPEIQELTFEHRGNQYRQYGLNKRDSLVLVARLSPEFTAAVVDRWQELEGAAPKLPQTFAEALRLAADQAEQIALMAPKVEVYDRIVDANNLYNATQVAQKIGKSAVWLNKQLSQLNVYNRSCKRGRAFQQWFIDKGYGIMRETENGFSQPMFYASGEIWVVEKLSGEGAI